MAAEGKPMYDGMAVVVHDDVTVSYYVISIDSMAHLDTPFSTRGRK